MIWGGLGLAVGKRCRVQGWGFRDLLAVGEGFEVKGVRLRVLGFRVWLKNA